MNSVNPKQHNPTAVQQLPMFVRLPEVLRLYYPVSKSTLWAKVRAGEFPAPIKLSARAVAWRRSEVEEFCRRLNAEYTPSEEVA